MALSTTARCVMPPDEAWHHGYAADKYFHAGCTVADTEDVTKSLPFGDSRFTAYAAQRATGWFVADAKR